MKQFRNTTEYTKFIENIGFSVIMPGDYDKFTNAQANSDQCRSFIVMSGFLGALLALSTIIVSILL